MNRKLLSVIISIALLLSILPAKIMAADEIEQAMQNLSESAMNLLVQEEQSEQADDIQESEASSDTTLNDANTSEEESQAEVTESSEEESQAEATESSEENPQTEREENSSRSSGADEDEQDKTPDSSSQEESLAGTQLEFFAGEEAQTEPPQSADDFDPMPEPFIAPSGFSSFASADIAMAGPRTISDVLAKDAAFANTGLNATKLTGNTGVSTTAPYTAGSLNAADLNDALAALKMMRYLAGLPYSDVTLSSAYNNAAQHKAVLLTTTTTTLTHYPPKPEDMDQSFYDIAQTVIYSSGMGECISAGRSNISTSVLTFIADSGSNNIAKAGHRMLLLNPGAKAFGFGYAKGGTDPFGGHRIAIHSDYSRKTIDTFMAWPAAGAFPIQYFLSSSNVNLQPEYPWSLSLGKSYQNPKHSDLTLTLTRKRDNKSWVFNSSTANLHDINPLPTGSMHLNVYDNNIVFRPDVTTLGTIQNGDVFTVNLTGIEDDTGAATSLQYDINFFDITAEQSNRSILFTVTDGTDAVAGATVTVGSKTATTNANGVAEIRVPQNSGEHAYTVAKAGKESVSGTVTVTTNDESANVTLSPAPVAASFVITGTSRTYDSTAASVTVTPTPAAATYTVTYNGLATVPTDAGTYAVVVQAGSGYTGSQTATLTISPAVINVTAENKAKKEGSADPALTYTYTGILYSTDAFSGELSRDAGETLGTYAINRNTLALGGNYTLNFTPGVFSIVDKEVQSIGLTVPAKTYGAAPFALTPTPDATSGLSDFSYSSGNTAVATVDAAGLVTIHAAGQATITVTEAGNSLYHQATATQTLTVAKAPLTVTVDSQNMTYGDAPPAYTFSYGEFVNSESAASLTTAPTVTCATTGKLTAGTHTLNAAGGVADNYSFTYISDTLTVAQKTVTVSSLGAFDKQYTAGDVTATINLSAAVILGKIAGDALTLDISAAIATFADDTVATGKTVTITGLALAGADQNNYVLSSTTATATASIRAALTAADVIAEITALTIEQDATSVALPPVPAGFEIAVTGSSNPAVISANGTIYPVYTPTQVTLTLEVTNLADGTTATTTLTVEVPAFTLPDYSITALAGANGSVSGGGTFAMNTPITLTATADANYRFDGWYENGAKVSSEASYSFAVTANRTLTAKFVAADSGSSTGGKSSSSAKSTQEYIAKNVDTPLQCSPNAAPNGTINTERILADLTLALSKTKTGYFAPVRTWGATKILPKTIAAMAAKAADAGSAAMLYADTMTADGKKIQARLFLPPAKLLHLQNSLKLGIYTEDSATAERVRFMQKWYGNRFVVIHCKQNASFGARLQIAAKVDLTGLNTSSLHFYSYNRVTNHISRINNPQYSIDVNGYLHFYTEKAGDIIITDKPLAPR